MSTLHVMDPTGDLRLQWSLNNVQEIEDARAKFNELKARGYMAYTVNDKGNEGEILHSFDPKAERIIMRGQMMGG